MLLLEKTDDNLITENWVLGGETVFFAFTLLATVGYGHLAPLTQYGKLFCMLYAFVGVPLTYLLFTVIVDRLECSFTRNLTQSSELSTALIAHDHKRYHHRNYWTINNRTAHPHHHSHTTTTVAVDGNIYLRTFAVWLVFILLIYMLPTYVFTNFTELNWTILDSVYYIYISITTIGFGDLVPGEEHSKDFRNVYRYLVTRNWLFYL